MAIRLYIAAGLRVVGLSLCALSAWAFAGLHLAGAAPEPVRDALRFPLVVAAVAVQETPAPEPSFTPTPAPKAVAHRGGPLEFSVSGSMNVGNRSSQTQRDASAGLMADSQSQTIGNVGMLAQVTRRTASTTLQIGVPVDLASTNTSTLGLAQISYATPHYELAYTAASASAFNQLPLGSTLRGFALILPFGPGDAQLFEGPAYGANGEILRMEGVRLRRQIGHSLTEFAVTRNAPGSQTSGAQTELAGIATNLGALTFVGEGALQQKTGDESSNAFAYQARADLGGADSGWSATVRHLPQRFLLYGTGETYGDSYADVSFRRMFHGQVASADVAFDASSLDGLVSSQRRSTFTYGGQIGRAQIQLGLQEQKMFGGTTPSQWTGQAGLQIATSSQSGLMLVGFQAGRTSQPLGGDIGTTALTAQISRMFGNFQLGAAYQGQRQTNSINGASVSGGESLSINRLLGRSSIGFMYGVNRAITPYSNAITRSPVLQVGRQISPALSLQVQYGRQSLTDRDNPLLSSHGRLFSVQINAPFAFGSGTVQGRSDPRLPASIVGRVLTDSGMNQSLAFLSSGGLGNVVVVLDNRDVERTDLAGNFRFSFVDPGQHTLRVESSSLPRGYTVDQPVATLSVDGGQTGSVMFQVGNFGAIAGHVFGRDASGSLVPLSDVELRVDEGVYAKTDSTGAYGFGRLLSGDHTVQIIPQSVPAFADFSADALQRKVPVQNGSTVTLDFTAEQLGSIAGTVTYLDILKPDFFGPVINAYVIAEPGEHAAITDADGSFVLDDLPPGDYKISIDPETLPDPTGAVEEDVPVTLVPSEHYTGLAFHVGRKKKAVVFTFMQQKTAPVEIGLVEGRLPPQGSTGVTVSAPADASDVRVAAFGHAVPLHYDKGRKLWSGILDVPVGARAGAYDVTAKWNGSQSGVAAATLKIDPQLPIAILQTIPAHAAAGQYVAVRARFLADVHPGDTIEWQDGTITTLGKPIAGRLFSFSLHLSLRPLHGMLLTRSARLPILLP